MDKVCPKCIDDYSPEKKNCTRCNYILKPANEFKVKAVWPHCKKCQTAVFESAVKCEHCGQSFYLIPFYPKISAFIMGLLGIAISGFLLDLAGVSRDVMNGGAFIGGAITWGIFIKQYHVAKKEGDVAWDRLSYKSRFAFRMQKRNEMTQGSTQK